ncbi:MAG: hypothetical protein M1371_11015 [Actinobacteria bacterium]|nr:hypothetical protein [Actinomycetota bacterium]
MSRTSAEILIEQFGIPEEKIAFTHHGTLDVPFLDPSYYKDQFHLNGRRVILTFGLIRPDKGIEIGLDPKELSTTLYFTTDSLTTTC